VYRLFEETEEVVLFIQRNLFFISAFFTTSTRFPHRKPADDYWGVAPVSLF